MKKSIIFLTILICSCTHKKIQCDCYDWNEETGETIITYKEVKALDDNIEGQKYCDAISTETDWCFLSE